MMKGDNLLDWLERMNDVIENIEHNLDGEIDGPQMEWYSDKILRG